MTLVSDSIDPSCRLISTERRNLADAKSSYHRNSAWSHPHFIAERKGKWRQRAWS